MPCHLTVPKMFCAGPNFLRHHKKLFTYCVSHNHFVPDKKMIYIQQNCFCANTKVFEEALNTVKFLGWLKKFGPAQNISGTVKDKALISESFLIRLKSPKMVAKSHP